MELWIRSQDKETLLKINRIYNFAMTIFAEDKNDREIVLGTYKTKERALEVLDEICEYIEKVGKSEIISNENGIMSGIKYFGRIYEMPKE